MIREDRFLISRRPYAADLSTLQLKERVGYQNRVYWYGRINAVWFRRRKGVTMACVGTLWDSQDTKPGDGAEFLQHHTDGRYGGDCDGRWDGARYWGAQEPDTIAEHLALLKPMLANYPNIPVGHDGWWTFQPAAKTT